MKMIFLVLLGLTIAALALYYFLFPKNMFYGVTLKNGVTITFSRKGVSYESAPDHFTERGIEQIDRYIPKFLEPSKKYKYLHMFTPDGERGFGLSHRDGVVAAGLSFDTRSEREREAKVRAFFRELGIEPSSDYLAANGEVPNAVRFLEYPVAPDEQEAVKLTKRILEQLCGITPLEALDVKYGEM